MTVNNDVLTGRKRVSLPDKSSACGRGSHKDQ
jgi:hypothetical protein